MGGYKMYFNFEITKREIMASISIIAILLLCGVLLAGKVSDYQMDKNETYNKAAKIETEELFEYGMNTNIGNAFVYGNLEAIDTVSYPEIDGEYMYIEKIKERYTMHTRTVTSTVNGKTQTRTETYWTWDRVGSEDKTCNEVLFKGFPFETTRIKLPSTYHIDTIMESSHIRYKYYGVDTKHTGTLFTNLANGTISNDSSFYKDKNIEETVDSLLAKNYVAIFWVVWIIMIGFCLYGFFYLENNWLE